MNFANIYQVHENQMEISILFTLFLSPCLSHIARKLHVVYANIMHTKRLLGEKVFAKLDFK